jgi:RNA polymerase sigma-70 factor (ECF subfamily)
MSGGDREQAQDLLQETFVKAWRGLKGFRGRSAFTTWLYRITVNVCRDAARRKRKGAGDTARPVEAAPEQRAHAVARVRETLVRLRKPHRVVLALRYTLSLSYEEIAETLNWSLPKVKVTIHRAKAAFRRAYEADGD